MPTWLNRRRFSRREMQLPIAYRRAGGGLCWTRTYDISAGGVKMRSLEPLRTGTPLELRLHIPAGEQEKVYDSVGTVIWCRSEEGSNPLLTCGVMFQQILLDLTKLR